MPRWRTTFLVALAGLAGCQGADAYYRYATQPPGLEGADAAIDGGETSSSTDGSLVDLSFPDGDGPISPAPDGAAGDAVDGAGEKMGCGLCALDVLYQCEGTAANTIRATFSLVNDTPAPVPLREVTIRYWFTGGNGGPPWEFACDNGTLGIFPPQPIVVTGEVTHLFRQVSPARPGADMYFEVGFTAAAGELLPGQFSLFRTRVYRMDYSNITQTDDYSFNSRNTVFGPSPQITMYRNGLLLSGVEPPNAR